MPASPFDDVGRARRGDRDALHRLLLRNEDRLRRLVQARLTPGLRARTRSSDILQSTFLQVLRSIETFRGDDEEQFSAWVVRIVENELRDQHRYFDAQKRRIATTLAEDPEDRRTRKGGIASPSSPLNFAEEFRVVQTALDRLKADYRQVLIQRLVDRLSHREIADALGRSEQAARVLFRRARAAFLTEIERTRDQSA